MTNFSEYLAAHGSEHDAAVAFFRSLRERGIHVSPRKLPKFISFGLDGQPSPMAHRIVENMAALDYDHADELLADLTGAGFHVDCSTLVKDPFVYGRNVNHDRTLAEFRARHSNRMGNTSTEAEAGAYLAYLADHRIKLSDEKRLGLLLPADHQPLLRDPSFIVDMALQTNSLLSRCNPGYSGIHLDRKRFTLAAGVFYEDYDRALETAAKRKGVRITDGPCSECAPIYRANF